MLSFTLVLPVLAHAFTEIPDEARGARQPDAGKTEAVVVAEAASPPNRPAPLLAALPRIEVVGVRERMSGHFAAAAVIDESEIERLRPLTVNELLRRIPGLTVRDEEGFGLRPNIAVRGLNPTRSTKTTLLEDGLPLAYAPYGDNASYFHPQVERYRQIEVLKGVETLLFGPQTVGGVINYLTADPTERFGGRALVSGGSRGFREAVAKLGGAGFGFDAFIKRGHGARDHFEHEIGDLGVRYLAEFAEDQSLVLRASHHREDSVVTYSGLTQAEFERLGPRYNPFRNDTFNLRRTGLSLTHRLLVGTGDVLTSLYYARFERDWWRQSSNSQDGQHTGCNQVLIIEGIRATFTEHRLAGRRVDPTTHFPCTQGRLRSYDTWGIEPRLHLRSALGEWQAGVRWHREEQNRRQINGTSALARTGSTVEDNRRETQAFSAFLAHRFDFGKLSVLPVVRREQIAAFRRDRLTAREGKTEVTRTLFGLGLRQKLGERAELFASWHRGFAPPRVEDLIAGSGTVTEVDPEDSRHVELGLRGEVAATLRYELAWFRNDFANLIAVGAIAGGGTPLSQGEALFSGLELALAWLLPEHEAGLSLSATWLPTARQETPFVSVATRQPVGGSRAGLRQPYAPRLSATLGGYKRFGPIEWSLEAQYVGQQFADFANTRAPTADGQRGIIKSATVWNSTLQYDLGSSVRTFLAAKNLFDKVYIVDRTRGIQTGMPRHIQIGLQYDF